MKKIIVLEKLKDLITKKIMLWLGNPKLKPFDVKNTKSVLARGFAGGIGDCIVLLGAIGELKKNYPGITVYAMQRGVSRDILNCSPYVHKAYPLAAMTFLKLRNKIDVYIDLKPQMSLSRLLYYRLLKPKKVIISGTPPFKYGFTIEDFSYYKDFKWQGKPDVITHNYDTILNSLWEFNLKPGEKKYELRVSEESFKMAQDYWKKDKKRVLLNIFGETNTINKETITSALNSIQKDFPDLDIVIPFSERTKEESLALCAQGGVLNARLSYKTTIEQFAALVKSSDLVISIDTATVHIACAFDKNLAAFYRKDVLVEWGPIGNNYDIVLCESTVLASGQKYYDFNPEEAEKTIRKRLSMIKK